MYELTKEYKEFLELAIPKYFDQDPPDYEGFFKYLPHRYSKSKFANFFNSLGFNFLKYIKEIPENFYSKDKTIEQITIPSNIKSIGDFAFNNCENLKSVIIEDGVESLGINCFSYCKNLEQVTLPNTISTIPTRCFDSCESLKRIDIPSSVKLLGAYCFAEDDDIQLVYHLNQSMKFPQFMGSDSEFMKTHLKYKKDF